MPTQQFVILSLGFLIFSEAFALHMYLYPQQYRERNPFSKWFPSKFTDPYLKRQAILFAVLFPIPVLAQLINLNLILLNSQS